MARTAMTVTTLSGVYPPTPSDLSTLATFDNANGMTFVPTGKEVLVFQNTTGGALTVTVISVADERGRTGNITTHSVADGAHCFIGPFSPTAWAQPTGQTDAGKVRVDASGALLYAVLRLP